jgi:hypothetical protein
LGKDITDEVVITGEEAFGDSVAMTTDEAIFLNFLCVYIPASASHLSSTG